MYLLTEADGYQYPRAGDTPYILDMLLLQAGVAVISTDQTLRVFDALRLGAGPKQTLDTPHRNITAVGLLDFSSCVVATAGENGTAALWDLRDSDARAQVAIQEGSSTVRTEGRQSFVQDVTG